VTSSSQADAVTTNPSNVTVNTGQNATFTTASADPTDSVQWQVSTDGGKTFTPLSDGGVYSGTGTGTLTITGATSVLNNNQYEAVFTNGSRSITSSAATLSVDYITTQPSSQTINAAQTVSFTAASSNPTGTDTVQWQVSTDGGKTFTAISNGGVSSGATSTTLTITGTPKAFSGSQYEAVFTNSSGSITSNAATLTVKPAIYILNANASGALSLAGNSKIDTSGLLDVNSSSSTAVQLSDNADVGAGRIQIHGGDQVKGNGHFEETPITAAAGFSDPLAGAVASTGGASQGPINVSKGTVTLGSGVYSSITVSGNGHLVFQPGAIIQVGSGGINVSGNATISDNGGGVLLYNSGALNLSGNANVNLTASSAGADAGIAIFQARDNANAVTISSNAVLNLKGGILYAANQQSIVTLSSNALVEASLVVNALSMSGKAEEDAL
jgi:hypothetical protein